MYVFMLEGAEGTLFAFVPHMGGFDEVVRAFAQLVRQLKSRANEADVDVMTAAESALKDALPQQEVSRYGRILQVSGGGVVEDWHLKKVLELKKSGGAWQLVLESEAHALAMKVKAGLQSLAT